MALQFVLFKKRIDNPKTSVGETYTVWCLFQLIGILNVKRLETCSSIIYMAAKIINFYFFLQLLNPHNGNN